VFNGGKSETRKERPKDCYACKKQLRQCRAEGGGGKPTRIGWGKEGENRQHDQGSWQGYKAGAFTGEKACLRPPEAPPARCVHEVEEDFHSEGGSRGEGRRLKK